MEDCIFCKIATGEIPCIKIWEDKDFLAFLDIYPSTKGNTLVMPKKHYPAYVFENDDPLIHDLMDATKKVAGILKKSLKSSAVVVVFEGLQVNHLHVQLHPLQKGETLKTVLCSITPKPFPDDLRKIGLEITGKSK